MGCDIKIYAEKKDKDGKWKLVPKISLFQDRNYFAFSFFAGVHNTNKISPIAEPRSIPLDSSKTIQKSFDNSILKAHAPSWLSLEELLGFNYDKKIYGEKDSRQGTYRDFLEDDFFSDVQKMKENGIERIVFWFYD